MFRSLSPSPRVNFTPREQGLPRSEDGRLPTVDGLRAIAVLAVVVFHAFPNLLSGGFIGVDIFFVISGFVIFLRYGNALVEKEVSFSKFFQRRIRRLLPAYVFAIVATTVAVFAVLPPDLLIQYGNSLVYQAFYMQNIGFLTQGDYFFQPTDKPLLHTWSLAVEEQLYLLFPVIILAIRRYGRPTVLVTIVGVGSFLLAMFIARYSDRAAFFLMPTRIWEFVAGMGAAMLFVRGPREGRAAGLSCVAGFAMMFASVIFFDGRAGMPSEQTVLAVLGTSLVLVHQKHLPRMMASVLHQPLTQHFGLISYSWYIWHWPMVALYVVAAGKEPSAALAICLLVAGYAAGALSYEFVELKARQWGVFAHARGGVSMLIAFMASSAALGWATSRSEGALWRYPAANRPYLSAQFDRPGPRCSILSRLRNFGGSICLQEGTTGSGGVLVVGDSFSNMIRRTMIQVAREHGSPLYYSVRICRGNVFKDKFDLCEKGYWTQLHRDIERHKISRVVLAAQWPESFSSDDIARNIRQLRRNNLRVYVLRNPPEGPEFDPARYSKGSVPRLRNGDGFSRQSRHSVMRRAAAETQALDALTEDPGIVIIDTLDPLCGRVNCRFVFEGRPLYSDESHLSFAGEQLLQPQLSRIFADD